MLVLEPRTPRAFIGRCRCTRFETYYEQSVSVTSVSGIVTIDLSRGSFFELSTTEDVTRFVINNTPGDSSSSSSFTIKIVQGSTPRTVDIDDFRTSGGVSIPLNWNGNIIPVVSSGANDVDIYSFMTFDGGSTYYGVVSGQNFGDLGARSVHR